MKEGKVKVGLIQMEVALEPRKNMAKAANMVSEAASRGADVVCLPELFAMRYFPTEKGASPRPERIPGPTSTELSAMAKKNAVVLIGGSLFEAGRGKNYNTCLVFSEDGETIGKYRKVHLPQDEHYFEQDYFSPGEEYTVVETSRGAIGTLICFDQWYPEAARVNKLMGAQMLFYPTAIGWVKGIEPVVGDWKRAWEAVQVGHAISNSVVLAAVNRVGRECETTFWGGSFVCDQFGKVLVRGGDSEEVLLAECDLQLGATVEEGWGFLRNRAKGTYGRITE